MERTRWQLAAEIARTQFGVISREQLIACGFSTSWIDRAVLDGRLIRVRRGIYALGHEPTDYRARLSSAVLLAGDDAHLFGHSAADLVRMLGNRTGRIWVAGPNARRTHREGVEIRSLQVPESEIGYLRGIRATMPSRTIIDIAAANVSLAAKAIEGAGNEGLLDVEDVLRLTEVHRGMRGVARVRKLVFGYERIPEFTRSELERRLYRLCRHAGHSLPDMNQEVYAYDGQLYECDAVWPDLMLIIECDSRWHDNPIAARRDAERDELLTLAGWRVFRLRWAQIALRPDRTAETIGRLIADQRRLLGATATPRCT
jgi:hypothetical protein